MASTITEITSSIDTAFPVPGQDNDTQGFRNNFANIKIGLERASAEINDLDIVQIGIANQLSNITNLTTFNGTTVTATSVTVNGNITATNIAATGNFIGNGSLLTNLPLTNITAIGTLTDLTLSNTETTATFSVSRGNLIINGVDSIVFYSTATTSTTYQANEGPGSFDSTLTFGSVIGINIGDSFKLFSTDTVHTVKGVNTVSNKITTEPFNPSLAIANGLTAGSVITFTKGKVAGSVSYTSSAPPSSKGNFGDKKGMVFADSAYVYVCYTDYINTTTDIWSRVSTTGATW
jgi:hypothetical protein